MEIKLDIDEALAKANDLLLEITQEKVNEAIAHLRFKAHEEVDKQFDSLVNKMAEAVVLALKEPVVKKLEAEIKKAKKKK